MSDNIDSSLIFTINFTSTAVLTVFALVGNSLVLFILSKPEFLKVSMFRYLFAATIFDTINVLASWPSVFPDAFQINNNSLSCKLYLYFFFIPFQTSPWIISMSSVDRYLSIKYPKSLGFRNKFGFQMTAIIIIVVAIIMIDTPFLIYHDVVSNETGCAPTTYQVQFYLDILNDLVSTIIPFCFMISTTLLTAYLLINQKAKLKVNSKKLKKEMQLIKILFALDFYFLICNLPCCILTIVDDVLGINYFNTLSFYILNALSNVFFSCDFFIYFSFNKLFKRRFISLLKCNGKDKKSTSKVRPSVANSSNLQIQFTDINSNKAHI